mmetsp:Transcript_12876/g.21781  ORF Transcript_12876/g.21781 Transcript_12876/m.21781 type:complete len:220 (-) Transcript_12876:3-662(-)
MGSAAAALLLADLPGRALRNLGGALVIGASFGLRGRHLALDFSRHDREGVFYVERVLGRGLQEPHVEVVGQLLALGVLHGSLVLQVLLVADEDAGDIFLCVLIDLAHPLGDLGEGVPVRDVIGHNNSVRPLVVAASDGLEPLLPGRVPDLQLNCLSVHVNCSDFEIHPDRGHEVVIEHVVRESEEQRGLADSGVADEEHFEEVIELGVHINKIRPRSAA